MTQFAEFRGECGEGGDKPKEAVSEYHLQLNQQVKLNGNADLSSCVVANNGGRVYGITLTGSPGIYDYVVNVDAQGPSGFGSGSMYLAFKDETGDVYYLSIYSSHRSVHTVRYNSEHAAIVAFKWSNYSFSW
jgi:hypothetical protein